jgi:beta-glucosidase
VLLVGENADCLHSGGGGSAEIKALYEISPLMGLKTHLGGKVKVGYTQGYYREEKSEDSQGNWQETSLEHDNGPTKPSDHQTDELEMKRKQLRDEAIQLAKEYETVIYVGGLNHDLDCEGKDREDMKLPYEQDILIQELLKVKPDLIVVIIGGSPVEMDTWIHQANTIVWGWYAGMEGGNALAEVLLGEVNPSGKLPETFYKTHRDCSAYILGKAIGDKKVIYHEGRYVGYRYYDKYHVEPQYCFGHGLSYTSFEYRSLSVDRIEKKILCYMKNTGNLAGGEIIQVYKRSNESEEFSFQELIGFEKVFLEGGEETQITLNFEAEIENGCELLVGSSSKDIRLTCKFDFK